MRNNDSFGTTGQPAVIYVPRGIYTLKCPLQLFVGTVVMGDPLDPPTLKAGPDFKGDTLIYGKDPHHVSTTNFLIAIKNLRLDSTSIDKNRNFTLLEWSVSQATQLTNTVFNMPVYSSGHTGVAMAEGGSGTHMGDLTFNGGAVGINMNNQQYEITSSTFIGCHTGILVTACFSCVLHDLSFKNSSVGIDMTPHGGHSVTLLDSAASHVGTVVKTQASQTGDHSLVIEHFSAEEGCSSVVSAGGKDLLSVNMPATWVYGNVYTSGGPNSGSHETGKIYYNPRPTALTSNGKYIHVSGPTYKDHDANQFINVKGVHGWPVYGDGVHDDTDNLNNIIHKAAGHHILFFPHGTYLVSDTLYFPSGSRVIGEAWSTISATGDKFKDAASPRPMIQVGKSHESGIAHFTDMLFTVSDVLPGCILLEVNMAGIQPGDVGFWNTHLLIGGIAGSKVQTKCSSDAADCKAAFMLVHLTSTSSAYIENMWGWTADHDLDGGNKQTISTGRGMLVEATAGTWLHATAIEHNTLYQYNFHNAKNVFVGMQQSEAPYWQGPGVPSSSLAPAPWTPSANYGDPDFSNCNGGDAKCRMAWYNLLSGCRDLSIYGSGFWTFFNANNGDCQKDGYCQSTASRVENTRGLAWYSINTHGIGKLILANDAQEGLRSVSAENNPGSWGAIVAAYVS